LSLNYELVVTLIDGDETSLPKNICGKIISFEIKYVYFDLRNSLTINHLREG
jgi:hypothetical protein